MRTPRTGARTRICVGIGIALGLAWTTGCGGAPQPSGYVGGCFRVPLDLKLGAEDLPKISDQYWRQVLEENPIMATRLGILGYDDKLQDASPEAIQRRLTETFRLRSVVDLFDESLLTERERITLAILRNELQTEIYTSVCETHRWAVDHLWGPQIWLLSLGTQTPIKTPDDERNYVARLSHFMTFMNQHIANLRAGLGDGLTAPRMNVERTLRQLDELAQLPTDKYPLLAASAQVRENRQTAFRNQIKEVVDEKVRPAFRGYRAFLADEVLAEARESVGIVNAIPRGTACYRGLINKHTSRNDTPKQIHELGLSEMKRIRAEMTLVAAKLFPGKALPDVLTMLREDPEYGFASRDDVHDAATAVVERAEARLPEVFSVLPKAKVEVKRMEPHAEKDSPMAYYFNPSQDGKRPGTYYVNTYQPETRPRYTAEVLAFHEAVPGHHLQIGVSMELEGIPEFQKHAGTTAFVEGWGLYSERLSDEMGLYTGELDRLGMLSFEAWRAARLVVDTGIHALGWSRQRAIDYMLANTASSLPDIENEVDRYITWPGQALAYKVGQIEILRLRERAKKQMGDRFDLREFHHRVLRNGAVPLDVLDVEIQKWADEGQSAPESSSK
jgi:uncharacterized protein (DUF885 family)